MAILYNRMWKLNYARTDNSDDGQLCKSYRASNAGVKAGITFL